MRGFLLAPGRISLGRTPIPSLGLHGALMHFVLRDGQRGPLVAKHAIRSCVSLLSIPWTLSNKKAAAPSLPHAGRVCITVMGVQRKSLCNAKNFPALS